MSTPREKTRHLVATLAELPVGGRKLVKVPSFGKEMELGLFNVNGTLVAYRNVCPHAGAPVCQGKICSTTAPSEVGEYLLVRPGEIVRCPWHGWEFDLLTGEHLVDEKMKLRGYEVQTASSPPKDENLEGYIVETEGEEVFVLV